MKKIDDNPFSFESYLLRDAQRITSEICERREHKISNSAVISVQRSCQLFKELESDSPSTPKIPRNSTPEEEKLFHALVNSLIDYREKMRGPLRYQNSQTGNNVSRRSDVSRIDTSSDVSKGTDLSRSDPSNISIDSEISTDSKAEESRIGRDNSNTRKNKGFTVEEEAAIDDDIYKQFGAEPFPGNATKENSGPSKKSSVDLQTAKSEPSNEFESAKNNDIKESKNQNIQTNMLLVLEELPSIMGIDKKVYGPLLPQDIVIMPEPNARILIKNQKGKSIQKYK